MPKIGLSKPYIAFYSHNGNTVTYTGNRTIGRFTELQINIDDSGDNDFYSDNEISETDNQFQSGNIVVTTDDLSEDTMQDAFGMDTEAITGTSGVWTINNDAQERPFLGFGGIVMKKVGGVISYVAVVFDKVRFRDFGGTFATKGKTIEWGTSSLTADIYRSDNARHSWRRYSSPFSTEAQAELALRTFLGYTPPAAQT